MEEVVRTFLAAHPAHWEGQEEWPLDPPVSLVARLCLATSLPPVECRSSILAIVTDAVGSVLFLEPGQPTGTIAHLLVGGRPEAGDAPEDTLRREVAEESGWMVEPRAVIGFRHLRQLGPRHPQLGDRPYPDFVQAIYAATATRREPSRLVPGEIPCAFVEAAWALEVTDAAQCPLLTAALEAIATR